MLKIGEFARLAQVSIKTLRHYERLGLLRPEAIDRFTSYRYYALEQLPRLNRILALKDLGFTLGQVRGLLRTDLSSDELRGMVRLRHAELQEQVETVQARLARAEARLRQIEREGRLPSVEAVLKSAPAQRVVGWRTHLGDVAEVPSRLAALLCRASTFGWTPSEDHPPLAIYYDLGEHSRGLDVELALPCDLSVQATGLGELHTLPAASQIACAIHNGPFDALPQTYAVLLPWIVAGGLRVAGPGREAYLRLPQASSPSVCVTEVQFPVENALSGMSQEQRRRMMEPQIVTKAAFQVVGYKYHGDKGPQEIPGVWERFVPRIGEIADLAGDDESYGVCLDGEGGMIDYIAGVPVSRVANLPADMEAVTVPANTYVAFPCTLSTLHQAYDYALNTWLPAAGYRRAPGPDFEYYPPSFANNQNEEMFVYIPIER